MADWAGKILLPHKGKMIIGEDLQFPEKEVFNTIFTGFTEIMDTYEALEFCETLFSVASPRSKKVPKEQYIKFLVNNYLQEVYILKERLNTYSTRIKRIHERAGRNELVSIHIEHLFPYIKDSLQGLVDIRGTHVHSQRYTDMSINEASSLALISAHEPEFESLFSASLSKVRKEWKARIEKNNVLTLEILDKYFKEMQAVVSDNGEVYTP